MMMMIAADAKGLMTSYSLLNKGLWLEHFKPSEYTYEITVPFNESLEDFLSDPNNRLRRNDFKKSVKQLQRSTKLSNNNKSLIRIMLNYAGKDSITKHYSFQYLLKLHNKLKQVGIGTPKFSSLKEINVAEKLIFINNQEKKNLQRIKKEQKKIKFNQNVIHDKKYGTDKDINNNYYKIRQISDFYDGLKYGNFWQSHFKLTKKQFDKLALIVSAQVPHYSSVKWDLSERLHNAMNFLTIKYMRSSAHSFRPIVYDPLTDANHGTYVIADNQLKSLLYELNPEASVKNISDLFQELSDNIGKLTTQFHEHADTQDLIVYNNGILDRKTGQLRNITADDDIAAKLGGNYDSHWLKSRHLPSKSLISCYGFSKLMLLLAKDYNNDNPKWKSLEYPFSQMNNLNSSIRKLNPYKYIYNLANHRPKRMICLIECLESSTEDLFAHDKIIIFNSNHGGTGKSTFMDIAQGINGLESTSHVNLNDLGGNNNFILASMIGMTLNSSNETTESGYIPNTSVIKQIASHEWVTVNIKYSSSVRSNFKHLTFIGSTNHGIRIKNNSGDYSPILRRFIIITFNNQSIAKHGSSSFRRFVINNPKVISFFAAFIGLCTPPFSKFTVDPSDMETEKDQLQTNSAITFLEKECLPELIYSNKCDYIGDKNSGFLVRLPKRLIFRWYQNYYSQSQNSSRAYGAIKFYKSLVTGLSNSDLPIKVFPQRTIRKSDVNGYKALVKKSNDDYLPTSRSFGSRYDFSKDISHVKRSLVINLRKPLFKGSFDDMKLEPKFKNAKSAKIKSNGNVVTIDNITNGVAVVSGLINSKPTKYRWISLSKLTPVISKSSRHLLEIKELSAIKANIWNETKQMDLELFIKYKYINNHYLRSDLRTIKFGLGKIKSLKGLASGLKEIYDKLYLDNNKFVIKKLGKLDLSNDRLGMYGVIRNTF